MLRILLPIGLFVAALLYFGGFLNSGYTRDVERPVRDVMTALEGLDVRREPGSPGTDPSRSGGVMPDFKLEREPGKMVWVVMAGDKVATRMIATLEPLKDGAATRIHAAVERGDAPEDIVSPAFRSEKITLGLFAAALESQINKLTLAWGPQCDQLVQEFLNGGSPGSDDRSTLGGAIGATSRDIMRIGAADTKLRAAGCDPDQRPKDAAPLTPAITPPHSMSGPAPQDEVRFEPGKPMIDPTVR
ncbi:hypothetical protein [Sphingobium sp. EM0848]|uniref:hypothetical protein n=1 Tax=Sphingobium sp. EM0848 TaxID=2743473 RepID=UPI00159BFE0E|nr:hypothetical protein [Sphingobium sp. EM0848]